MSRTGLESETRALHPALTSTIDQVKQLLSAGNFRSEAEISQGVVKPILANLDWPVFDVQVVAPEFRIGTKKVDYALCHKPRKPSVLLEVKDLGKATKKGEKQLFEYCFSHGVPIAVLTDGQTWSFYLPAGLGSYEERRFARIDLVADDTTIAARILTNYLHREEVLSGEAWTRAQRDYQATLREEEVALKFPSVWKSLVSGILPSAKFPMLRFPAE